MTGENPPVRKLGYIVHVSQQEAIDAGIIPDPRSPEVIAAENAIWEQRRAARTATVQQQHAAVLAATTGALRDIAVLHGPSGDPAWLVTCQGCDQGAWAESDPGWPCRTYRVIAESAGVDIDGIAT